MKLEELHESPTDNLGHAVAAFGAAVSLAFGAAYMSMYNDFKDGQKIVKTLAEKDPAAADMYRSHLKKAVSLAPKTPDKAKEEMKAAKQILDQHGIKK